MCAGLKYLLGAVFIPAALSFGEQVAASFAEKLVREAAANLDLGNKSS